MKELNKNQFGLIMGLFFAALHIAWSLLVAIGFAQVLINWILWLHFINISVHVENFELTRAVLLVIVAFIVGYVVGYVSTWMWNMIIKKSK